MRGGVDSDFAARSLGLTELPRISTQEWHSEHVCCETTAAAACVHLAIIVDALPENERASALCIDGMVSNAK